MVAIDNILALIRELREELDAAIVVLQAESSVYVAGMVASIAALKAQVLELTRRIVKLQEQVLTADDDLSVRVDLLRAGLLELAQLEEEIMGLVAVVPATPPGTGTFVATDGDDGAGDGSLGSPYLTVEKARDEISLSNNVNPIQVRGGNYYLTSTIAFDSGDNGLTIQNYLAETPIFYGGALLTGMADGGNTWTKTVAEVFQLTLNGVGQPRSALPVYDPNDPYEGGWFFMDAGSTAGKIFYKAGDIESGLTDLTNLKVYFYGSNQWWAGNAVVTAINHTTREISITTSGATGHSGNPAQGMRFRLLDVKPQGTAKVLQPGEWWHSGTVLTYREVDAGFDGTGLVGGTMIQMMDNWNAGTPATNLTIDGLTFRGAAPWIEHTNIGARYDVGGPTAGQGHRQCVRSKGDTLTVKNCKFEYCGGGVGLHGSASSTIYNNEFKFIDHAAITFTDGSNNLLIDHNLFEDSPHTYRAFQTIAENNSVTTDVSTPFTVSKNRANRIGGRWLSWGSADATFEDFAIATVEFNKLVDTCMEVHDAGPIYLINRALATRPSAVTNIRHNWIENPLGAKTTSAGVFARWEDFSAGPNVYGVYLDDGVSLVDLTGNIVIGKHARGGCWGGYFIHSGFENNANHNIFLNTMIWFSNLPNRVGDWGGTAVNEFNGNIVSRRLAGDDGGMVVEWPADSGTINGRLFEIVSLQADLHHEYWNQDNNFYYTRETATDNEIPFCKDASAGEYSLATFRGKGTPHDENGTVGVNPNFTDATNDDYTLQSGAVKTAFGADLLFSQMGRV